MKTVDRVARQVDLDRPARQLEVVAGRCRPAQVLRRLSQSGVQVEVVRGRYEEVDLRFVEEASHRADPLAGDGLAVEGAPVREKGRELVGHARVEVDPAVVLGPRVPQPAEAAIGIAVDGRVGQAPDGAPRQVLAHEPTDGGSLGAARVREVDELAEDVRQGLVDRSRLAPVDQVRLALGHRVGQLVGHDVIGRRVARPEPHLRAVPVGVRKRTSAGRLAVAHPAHERAAGAVVAVASKPGEVEVVGVTEVLVGEVDVGDARGRPTLAADERAERSGHVGRVVDRPALRVLDVGVVERHLSRGRVHQDDLVDVARPASNTHMPDEAARTGRSDDRGLVDHQGRGVGLEAGTRGGHGDAERGRGRRSIGDRRFGHEIRLVHAGVISRDVGQNERDPAGLLDLHEGGRPEDGQAREALLQAHVAPVGPAPGDGGPEAGASSRPAEGGTVLAEEGEREPFGAGVAARTRNRPRAPRRRDQRPDVAPRRPREVGPVTLAPPDGGQRKTRVRSAQQPVDPGLDGRIASALRPGRRRCDGHTARQGPPLELPGR